MANVLVIDDSKTILKGVQVLLESHGHSVKPISSYSVIFEVLPTFKPDVILLDLEMPGFDGCQMAKIIRSYYGSTMPPIILYTSCINEEKLEKAQREIKPETLLKKNTAHNILRSEIERIAKTLKTA